MAAARPIWLVNNVASGSNDDAALAALETCCDNHGLRVAHRTVFPAQDLPTPAMLDAGGIDLVAVFAGDGTVNALVAALAGWHGAVMVLPGGTMNLLYRRLHGELELEDVVAAAARGEARRHRPGVIRNRHGDAFAGVLAGPGSSWGQVREAMREKAMLELAEKTVAAIQHTLTGETIICTEPALGAREGYPLINLTPTDGGIAVDGYDAATAKEYLDQTWALLKRDFREGPHDSLGMARQVRLASSEGHPFGLLIDGEQAEGGADEVFTLARAEVDLLATR